MTLVHQRLETLAHARPLTQPAPAHKSPHPHPTLLPVLSACLDAACTGACLHRPRPHAVCDGRAGPAPRPAQGAGSMHSRRRPAAGAPRGPAAGGVTPQHGRRHWQQLQRASGGGSCSSSGGGGSWGVGGCGAWCRRQVLLLVAAARGVGRQPQQPDFYVKPFVHVIMRQWWLLIWCVAGVEWLLCSAWFLFFVLVCWRTRFLRLNQHVSGRVCTIAPSRVWCMHHTLSTTHPHCSSWLLCSDTTHPHTLLS